jgi:hypothetical protein
MKTWFVNLRADVEARLAAALLAHPYRSLGVAAIVGAIGEAVLAYLV